METLQLKKMESAKINCIKNLFAKEWACTEGVDGYSNRYEIETDELNILKKNF